MLSPSTVPAKAPPSPAAARLRDAATLRLPARSARRSVDGPGAGPTRMPRTRRTCADRTNRGDSQPPCPTRALATRRAGNSRSTVVRPRRRGALAAGLAATGDSASDPSAPMAGRRGPDRGHARQLRCDDSAHAPRISRGCRPRSSRRRDGRRGRGLSPAPFSNPRAVPARSSRCSRFPSPGARSCSAPRSPALAALRRRAASGMSPAALASAPVEGRCDERFAAVGREFERNFSRARRSWAPRCA